MKTYSANKKKSHQKESPKKVTKVTWQSKIRIASAVSHNHNTNHFHIYFLYIPTKLTDCKMFATLKWVANKGLLKTNKKTNDNLQNERK